MPKSAFIKYATLAIFLIHPYFISNPSTIYWEIIVCNIIGYSKCINFKHIKSNSNAYVIGLLYCIFQINFEERNVTTNLSI